ncbi:hypothetical protein Clacol_006392 [Clathrus columnatus]|uniref:ABC transporter domain-containing protein n=1 Tax=Clathrus columnatus TaxID=1419009 RepID=A0AAV5ABY3_9AGAM|nr:hypothetical protein Clacol_006392 [Clathrus columnatus]
MENNEGVLVDLYIPRKCAATNRLITAKDHASVQINIVDVDADGKALPTSTTFALCGQVRAMAESDDSINRLATKAGFLLSAKGLACARTDGHNIFENISFELREGDILVLSGRSGSGKTTVLKCLSHLNVYQGEVLLHGRKVSDYSIPTYRTRVLYVPQRPSLLPSTPREFVKLVLSYSSRKSKSDSKSQTNSRFDIYTGNGKGSVVMGPIQLAEEWGIDEELWDRPWISLSGGESQRIALAVAVGLPGAEILLLDEPTSALDAETTLLVENTLQQLVQDKNSSVKGLIWITHSEEQSRRIGTRFLYLDEGSCLENVEMGLPSSHSRSSTNASNSNSSL